MHPIVIVGEAWGYEEERQRSAFVGSMSSQLRPMLHEAGIHPADCYLTNVFNIRYDGKIEVFCGPKEFAIPGYGPLIKGKYVRAEFAPELARLAEELMEVNPNLIIAMGNTPLWALTNKIGISKLRGTTLLSTHTVKGFKLIPTYHPAAIIHQWQLRPTTVMDLMKAKRECEFAEIRRPELDVFIPETIGDLYEFDQTFLRHAIRLAVDIETSGQQITCIGFAPNSGCAIVIPFVDYRRNGRSFWTSTSDEQEAWGFVRDTLANPKPPKIFQNGMYDIAFLLRAYGIRVMGAEHDTMLLHHALQPESLKGLGYLGSLYTDHPAWKTMRDHKTTIKRDD